MRRLNFSILVFILTVFIFSISSYASNTVKNTELKLKINDKTIYVNSEEKEIETAPYIINDTTMVPLRVITEAFGAQVDWDDQTQEIILVNENKIIKLAIGKDTAVVNRKTVNLNCAPILSSEGVTMVPLRFISESYGAKVAWFEKTEEILVVLQEIKVIVDDENSEDSIDDLLDGEDIDISDGQSGKQNTIFQNITESKIGDSYYGWSMNFPKGAIITYKDKNGKEVDIANKNDKTTYSVKISKIPKSEMNIDEWSMLKALDGIGGMGSKCINEEIYKSNGVNWARTIYCTSEGSIGELRITVHDGYIFKLEFEDETIDGYLSLKEDSLPSTILDSFGFGYTGDGKDIKNINELENGMYTYKDENFNWSIQLPVEISNTKQVSNNISMINYSGGADEGVSVKVEFYSQEENKTLDNFVTEEVQNIQNSYNRNYFYIISKQDCELNGNKAKKITYEYKYGKDKFISYCVYFIEDNIRYCISINGYAKFFSDEQKRKYDKIFKTFKGIESINKFKDINITNSNKLLANHLKIYTNPRFKWSIIYPSEWDAPGTNVYSAMYDGYYSAYDTIFDRFNVVLNDDIDCSKFSKGSNSLWFSVNTYNKGNYSLTRLEKITDNTFNLSKDAEDGLSDKRIVPQLISKEDVAVKDTNAVKYKYKQDRFVNGEYITDYYTVYLFEANNRVFEVVYGYSDEVATDYNISFLDNMWQSLVIIK